MMAHCKTDVSAPPVDINRVSSCRKATVVT
jgi:hypothetical protein